MADHTITVTYTDGNPPVFKYKDESGGDGKKLHCKAGDTITWTLDTGNSTVGASNLQIRLAPFLDSFGEDLALIDDGDTITCNAGSEHGKVSYQYDAFVTSVILGVQHDDPEIIFDDGTLDTEARTRK